jgi:hypothetical protein
MAILCDWSNNVNRRLFFCIAVCSHEKKQILYSGPLSSARFLQVEEGNHTKPLEKCHRKAVVKHLEKAPQKSKEEFSTNSSVERGYSYGNYYFEVSEFERMWSFHSVHENNLIHGVLAGDIYREISNG